jgi:anti-sigma factor RsiW
MNATAGSHERFEELAAGYALGALEPAEEQAFVRHMEGCERCVSIAAEFSDLAADLAVVSDDIPAPANLWESISGVVTADTGRAGSGPAQQSSDTPPVIQLDQQRAKKTARSRRIPALTAAAASVAVLAIGGIVAATQLRGSDAPSGSSAIADCRKDAACQAVDLVSSANGTSAVALVRGSNVTLVSTGLTPIDPRNETYVLWQMPDQGFPTAVLAFAVTSDSRHPVATGHLPLPTERGTALAVSREKGTSIPATPSEPVARTANA